MAKSGGGGRGTSNGAKKVKQKQYSQSDLNTPF